MGTRARCQEKKGNFSTHGPSLWLSIIASSWPLTVAVAFEITLCSLQSRRPTWILWKQGLAVSKNELSANGLQSPIFLPSRALTHPSLLVRLNTKLESQGYQPMTSLVKDLSDGVRLIQLMVRFPTPLGYILIYTAGNHGYIPPVFGPIDILNIQPAIGDVSLGRYNKNPWMRVQKAENVNRALEFINSRGVKLTNIGPEGSAPALQPPTNSSH